MKYSVNSIASTFIHVSEKCSPFHVTTLTPVSAIAYLPVVRHHFTLFALRAGKEYFYSLSSVIEFR